MHTVRRGLLAGAAGTALLNAVTYLDMAVRGRPASQVPEQAVDDLLDRVGVELPGSRSERANRRTALGALTGTASGLGIGVALSVARRAGWRPGRVVGVLGSTAAAMTATNCPMAVLGVTDPRDWSAAEWAADAVPHLAYAVAADAVLRLDPLPEATDASTPAGVGLLVRSAALGAAAGSRSSLAVAGPTAWGRGTSPLTGRLATALALAGAGTELVVDKLPATPSRLGAEGLVPRFVTAGTGAVVLARRDGARPAAPVVSALAGAAGGAWGGAAWRRWAHGHLPDWQAALLEDAVALALSLLAVLPGRRHPAPPPRP
jgi:uncharacterized membrane protein